jgi:FAD synthase
MKTVYALGYFECVHKGHKAVLRQTVKLAKKLKATSGCFSYTIEQGETVRPDRLISKFAPEERAILIQLCGIKTVYLPRFSSIKNLSAEEFLTMLVKDYEAAGFVCGEDYRFGKGAKGTVETLKDYCESRNIEYKIVKTVYDGKTKISSKNVKKKTQE